MNIGDNIVVNEDIFIDPCYARHGKVIDFVSGTEYVIMFADGVVEHYHPYECQIISKKEYFKLQLS